MQNTPAIPCFEFADNTLHIRIPRTELRIRWSPSPKAEEKNFRGAWKECSPNFRILRPLSDQKKLPFELDVEGDDKAARHQEQKRQAFNAFRSVIPPELITVVERFGSHQWSLLKLLHAEQAAVDITCSNPVLVYCLANNAEFRGTCREAAELQAVRYSHAKQRVIAKWLGFPDTEAFISLLKKIYPGAVCPSRMRCLRLALQGDRRTLELFAHHGQINAGMLELVINHHLRPLVTAGLIREVAVNPGDMVTADTANLLLDALSILRQIAPGRAVRPFMRISQVLEFSRAADAEYMDYPRQQVAVRLAAVEARERERHERQRSNRSAAARRRREGASWQDDRLRDRPFPPPPIPGTREIVPLTCAADLRAEGNLQNNCVGSYAGRVTRGKTYIYRVMYPERATLSIIRGADGCWHRDQLKKAGNQQVRQSTKTFVDNWLAKYRLSV